MLNNNIFHGDALEVLKTFPNDSIDFIITSPPYASQRKKNYFSIPEEEYTSWFIPIANELYRVLKNDGSFILNIKENVVNGERSLYVIHLLLALKANNWKWVEEYSWNKTTAFPGKWPTRFRDSFERCFHFAKTTKGLKMNQDAVKVPIGDWSKTRFKYLTEQDKTRRNSGTGNNFTKNLQNWEGKQDAYPTNVLTLAPECGNKEHPAVFPISLPTWFIKLFSNENDLILDPFMGSGTTALACLSLNRNYVGIEKEEKYVELIKRRLFSYSL